MAAVVAAEVSWSLRSGANTKVHPNRCAEVLHGEMGHFSRPNIRPTTHLSTSSASQVLLGSALLTGVRRLRGAGKFYGLHTNQISSLSPNSQFLQWQLFASSPSTVPVPLSSGLWQEDWADEPTSAFPCFCANFAINTPPDYPCSLFRHQQRPIPVHASTSNSKRAHQALHPPIPTLIRLPLSTPPDHRQLLH